MTSASVDLFWVPIGAGPHGAPVRWIGRLYEAVAAAREHRPRRQLFHTALVVRVDGATTRIELAAPVRPGDRGIVAEGSVGSRLLGRSHHFRYEVRRWRGGPTPRVPPALEPIRLSTSATAAAGIIALVPQFPICTWGRDELGAGEMWNSNSLVSWLLARAGASTAGIGPPRGGRAPGWEAGLRIAHRSTAAARAAGATGA
jgi:hypothetical protein